MSRKNRREADRAAAKRAEQLAKESKPKKSWMKRLKTWFLNSSILSKIVVFIITGILGWFAVHFIKPPLEALFFPEKIDATNLLNIQPLKAHFALGQPFQIEYVARSGSHHKLHLIGATTAIHLDNIDSMVKKIPINFLFHREPLFKVDEYVDSLPNHTRLEPTVGATLTESQYNDVVQNTNYVIFMGSWFYEHPVTKDTMIYEFIQQWNGRGWKTRRDINYPKKAFRKQLDNFSLIPFNESMVFDM